MNKLFIHQPVFRLLGPVFIGVMMYLLILLLNNDTSQIGFLFEGQEVYVCIITSYLIIEINRWIIRIFDRYQSQIKQWQRFSVVGTANILISSLVASSILYIYFTIYVGFSPSSSELWIFNMICVVISILYFTLYLSHSLLYSENTIRLANEKLAKDAIVDEFENFKNDINPDLLYSSLERVIILAYENPDKAEELIDHLSSVYRYILGHKQTELTSLSDELKAVEHLIYLLNKLPGIKLKLELDISSADTEYVIPATIISIIEYIAKSNIYDEKCPICISLYEEEEYLVIQYKSNSRLAHQESHKSMEKTHRAYSYFTDIPLVEVSTYEESYTKISKLVIEQEKMA